MRPNREAEEKLTLAALRSMLHYDPLTGIFTWLVTRAGKAVAGSIAGRAPRPGKYSQVQINGRNFMANRLAWFYMTGEWPKDMIDHKNRVRSDDRWENLRPLNNAQNCQNQSKSKNNTSGHKGVSWDKATQKWHAYIRVGSLINLGFFDDIGDAVAARRAAEPIYHPYSDVEAGLAQPASPIILPN